MPDCHMELCPMWDGHTCPCATFGLDPDNLPDSGTYTIATPTPPDEETSPMNEPDHDTTDQCSPPPNVAALERVSAAMRRSPAERIADMRATDQDPDTAAPLFVVVPTDDLAAAKLAKAIGGRLGEEISHRRYLVGLVERLLAGADEITDEVRRDHDRADPDDSPECQRTADALAGAERVLQVLHNIMQDGRKW